MKQNLSLLTIKWYIFGKKNGPVAAKLLTWFVNEESSGERRATSFTEYRSLRWPNTVFQCTGVIKHYLKTTYF